MSINISDISILGSIGLPQSASAHNTPIKQAHSQQYNPNTSPQGYYKPVQRSKSLAVARPKVTVLRGPERPTTPPFGNSASRYSTDAAGLEDWSRMAVAELDRFDLPKSMFLKSQDSTAPQKFPSPLAAHDPDISKQAPLADILVESKPVRKEYDHQPPPVQTKQMRHSSDDILETSKYIKEGQAIDSYVSLTGTRRKSKNRRVSDPFTGLLPGKSLSADQLDSQFGSLQGGLRSREESIEQLRGSNNGNESAFTSKLEQTNLPTPTSSEEELRGITGLRGGKAVKRSHSMTTGTYMGNNESGFPRQARVRVLANNFSKSLDSTLESSRVGKEKGKREKSETKKSTSYISKYQEASPSATYAYVPKKHERESQIEDTLFKEKQKKEKVSQGGKPSQARQQPTLLPQPATLDPAAIRSALIEELKSGQFNLSPSPAAQDLKQTEPKYAAVNKSAVSPQKKEKVPTKKSQNSNPPINHSHVEKFGRNIPSASVVERGIYAARSGDLDALKSLLLADHLKNPQGIDKRTSVYKNFYSFSDEAKQSNLIHITSEHGQANCLKWLVLFAPSGSCIALNKERLVPAILAIRKGSLSCVRILVLDANVPLTIIELESETLLHHAAFNGQANILKWLIEYMKEKQGSTIKDSDFEDVFGVTPAHFAAQQGYLDCLQVLQDAMCNLWPVDHHNQTPMDWAVAAGQKLTANYLFMVQSVRYLSEQLTLERKHSKKLQDKVASVESAYSKFKEEYEDQINLVKEEFESRTLGMKEEFLNISGTIIKESKGGKPKKRGVFRTFSLPTKHRTKKSTSKTEISLGSAGESSPEEPRQLTEEFPNHSMSDEIDPVAGDFFMNNVTVTIHGGSNEEMLSTIDEASTITAQTQRDSVLHPSEEHKHKIDVIHEMPTSELLSSETQDFIEPEIGPVNLPLDRTAVETANNNAEIEIIPTPTLQKLKEENISHYRSSPDPYSSEEILTTPESTLQRKKRHFFNFKSSSKNSSKNSLKEDGISRKSTDSTIASRVGESTGCTQQVSSSLKRLFGNRREQTVHSNSHLSKSIDLLIPQKDQVTLEIVESPVSPLEIETDFIAESECSSHNSGVIPNRRAPEPPLVLNQNFARKLSYVTSIEDPKIYKKQMIQEYPMPIDQRALSQGSQFNYPTHSFPQANQPYPYALAPPVHPSLPAAQYGRNLHVYPQQLAIPHNTVAKHQSYPGVVPLNSQERLYSLEPYSRQTDRLLDSGFIGRSSDSLDVIRPKTKQTPSSKLQESRTVQGYSAPTSQAFLSQHSTPEKHMQQQTASWPRTGLSTPQRSATVYVQNPYQHAQQHSRRVFSANKSTTISDL